MKMMYLVLVVASVATTVSFSVQSATGLRHHHYCSSTSVHMVDEEPKKRGPQYRFGSITETIVRGVTGNNDYQFGDGTKAVVGKSAQIAKAAAEGVSAGVEVTDAAAKAAVESAAKSAADAAEAAGKSAAEVAQASVEAASVAAEVYVAADAAGKELTAVAASAATDAAVKAAGASINAGAAAKEALDERYDGYEFGDVTKEAAGAAKSGIEQAMRKATGNDEYQFGDVTKKLASGFLGKLSEAAGAAKDKLEDDGKKK